MEPCKICGGSKVTTIYNGPIRIGRYGQFSETPERIVHCNCCKSKWRVSKLANAADYYEGEEYRKEVDITSDAEDFYALHDGEQAARLSIVGASYFRNRVVADIGSGAGSFLDVIKGVAREAVAVEPSDTFRKILKEKGYRTYSYAKNASADFNGRVDIAVTFSVIEHVEDPVLFLNEINSLLRDSGSLVLSTPNSDDILLDAIPDIYPSFYFRKAHLWYFNPVSLRIMLEKAGFEDIEIIPHQRFGLGNFINWTKDRKPGGDCKYDFVTTTMDACWKAELERTFRCDYLYCRARKTKSA